MYEITSPFESLPYILEDLKGYLRNSTSNIECVTAESTVDCTTEMPLSEQQIHPPHKSIHTVQPLKNVKQCHNAQKQNLLQTLTGL